MEEKEFGKETLDAQEIGLEQTKNDVLEQPLEKKSNNSFKKYLSILKSKKVVSSIASIIIVAIITVFLISQHYAEKRYEKNLKEFVNDSGRTQLYISIMCEDIYKVWKEFIFDEKIYFDPETGNFYVHNYNYSTHSYNYNYVCCKDFSDAISHKIQWFKKIMNNKELPTYVSTMRLYKEMTPPPYKYKETHKYVKQMFKSIERLHDLSKCPTGNIYQYSTKCAEAVHDYTSALSDIKNETDIDFTN